MKILMLTPYLPYPPASGGQIRTLYLLKYLSKVHDITLVALYKNDEEKKYMSKLDAYCKKVILCKRAPHPWQIRKILKSVFSALPFLIVRNYSDEAKKTVTQLLKSEHFDVIHAETFYIMPHIPHTAIPILLVEQTIEYKVYKHFISHLWWFLRIPLSLDIRKLKHWELYYWKKADMVATVSDSDRNEMISLIPSLQPQIIPNGAGDEMFDSKLQIPDLDNPIILFVGNFFWLQNVEAAEYLIQRIFPLVLKKLPHIRLIVAGQNTGKLKHLRSTRVKLIDLAPSASEKVKALYHHATLFAAPIFGPGGTRLKILASMAAGLPVISTRTGLDGLQITNGTHALLAETPEEFVMQICHILSDKSSYTYIQKNAFDHVQSRFSWQSITHDLDRIYRTITKSRDVS